MATSKLRSHAPSREEDLLTGRPSNMGPVRGPSDQPDGEDDQLDGSSSPNPYQHIVDHTSLTSLPVQDDETDAPGDFSGSGRRHESELDPGDENAKDRFPIDLSSQEEHNLPLPPFLRPKKKITQRFAHLNFEPPLPRGRGNEWTYKESMKKAPFSTKFNQNPYARALGVPVRECAFTTARVPRTCLLDFHLVEHGANADRMDGESPVGINPKSRQDRQDTRQSQEEDVTLEFLPLSLYSSRHGKKGAERRTDPLFHQAREIWRREATSMPPLGSASYTANRRAALEHVTERPERRVRSHVCSRRVDTVLYLENPGKNVGWRKDMPDMVLSLMRKAVSRNLRSMLLDKKRADEPGLVMTMPGNAGKERLDQVDDAMSVLRLTRAAEEQPNGKTTSRVARKRFAREMEKMQGVGQDGRAAGDVADDSISRFADLLDAGEDAEAEALGVDPALEKPPRAEDPPPTSKTAPERGGEEEEQEEEEPPSPVKTNRSRTRRSVTGPWTAQEEAETSFFRQLNPLPAPRRELTLYFPTLRYRNRRVALYSLPHLLGDELTAEVLEGTLFEGKEYVVVAGHAGTTELQIALLRLHAHLAGDKAGAVKI